VAILGQQSEQASTFLLDVISPHPSGYGMTNNPQSNCCIYPILFGMSNHAKQLLNISPSSREDHYNFTCPVGTTYW